jgi:hypothetical protein
VVSLESICASDTAKSFEENVANNKAGITALPRFFQFYVSRWQISCQIQRSADIFWVPLNIAYALLTMMMRKYNAGCWQIHAGDTPL